MKTMKSIVLCVITFTQTVKAQNNDHKYYLEGQICSGFQQSSFSGGVGGAFGFFVSPKGSVDLRAREIYNFPNRTMIGAISVNYRYHFTNGFFVGAGFGHHHEISEHDYLQHPAEASLGSHHSILHRSGLAAEIGYNFKPLAKQGLFSCIYPATNIMITHMVMDHGRNPLVTANVGIRIGLRKF
jgi:hypothetical protein